MLNPYSTHHFLLHLLQFGFVLDAVVPQLDLVLFDFVRYLLLQCRTFLLPLLLFFLGFLPVLAQFRLQDIDVPAEHFVELTLLLM